MLAVLLAAPAAAQATLPDLRGARAIVISDHGTGEGPAAPVRAGYHIQRQDESGFFAGSARFTVMAGTRGERGRNALVALPAGLASRFLAALAAVPVAEGRYQPAMLRTDDYPSVTSRVELDGAEVEFHSTSQAAGMRPWRVTVNGRAGHRQLVSDSDAVWRALLMLRPHPKRDVLDALRRGGGGG